MKLKRKYIHLEFYHGNLYVYADSKSGRDKTFTLDNIDNECLIAQGLHFDSPAVKIKIPLKDFIEE